MSLRVIAPGLVTTVQDVAGRPHATRFGVSVGGAADPFAARAANLLVGNDPNAALIETTGPPLILAVETPTVVAVAGADFRPTLNGWPLPRALSVRVAAGATLALTDRRHGARAYLAFAGGIEAPTVLGGRGADLRGGFGGVFGRALQAGDYLRLGAAPDLPTRAGRSLPPGHDDAGPIRVLPGPHRARFAPGAWRLLTTTVWRVTDQTDRMGYRLNGPRVQRRDSAELASIGVPAGAVQVPTDGQPIVLLTDHQPTGGYPVIACVIAADLPKVAQRLPGDPIRFTPTTQAKARQAWLAQQRALEAIAEDFGWRLARSAC